MSRRLFCETSPAAYRLSLTAHRLKRHFHNALRRDLARTVSADPLPVRVYDSASLIRRTLGGADPALVETFCKVIRGELTVNSTAEHGLLATALGQAAEMSRRQHRMVEMSEIL